MFTKTTQGIKFSFHFTNHLVVVLVMPFDIISLVLCQENKSGSDKTSWRDSTGKTCRSQYWGCAAGSAALCDPLSGNSSVLLPHSKPCSACCDPPKGQWRGLGYIKGGEIVVSDGEE